MESRCGFATLMAICCWIILAAGQNTTEKPNFTVATGANTTVSQSGNNITDIDNINGSSTTEAETTNTTNTTTTETTNTTIIATTTTAATTTTKPIVLATSSATSPPPPSTAPMETDKPRGEELVDPALVPVYRMANFFLEKMVQPRHLTYMEEKGVNFSDLDALNNSFEEKWEEWTLYWIGYVICAVVGVLLFIIMPIVGMVFACCRCCGHCGGLPDRKESSNAKCLRGCYGTTLFLLACLLLLGAIPLFATNERLSENVKGPMFDVAIKKLQNIDEFMSDTVQSSRQGTLETFEQTKEAVFAAVDSFPGDAIKRLDSEYEITHDLDTLEEFFDYVPTAIGELTDANNRTISLQTYSTEFNNSLVSFQTNATSALENCNTSSCTQIDTSLLEVEPDYSNIYLTAIIDALNFSVSQNLSGKLAEGLKQLDIAKQRIETELSEPVGQFKNKTNALQAELETYLNELEDLAKEFNLSSVQEAVQQAKDDSQWPLDIYYWTIVAVSSTILLIIFCFLMGLLLGACCPLPHPGEGTCENTQVAANWLLAGTGFSFLFYWIYVIILLVLFIGFGGMHTELCRHAVNFGDSPIRGIVDKVTIAAQDNFTDPPIRPSQLYDDCKQNEALYNALKLEKRGINITELLDISPIRDVIDDLRKRPINISDIQFLAADLQDDLVNLGNAVEVFQSFVPLYIAEFEKNITKTDLEQFAQDLEGLRGEVGIDNSTISNLVAQLRQYQTEYVEPMRREADAAKSLLTNVSEALEKWNVTAIAVKLGASQEGIATNGTAIVQDFFRTTVDAILANITQAVQHIDSTVRTDIGKCRPVYDATIAVIDVACVEVVWTGNGFVFALGWVVFFLLPSMIFACKLATQYRKTIRYDDSDFETPLYDAYTTEQGGFVYHHTEEMQLQKMKSQRTYDMNPVDNPVYSSADEHPYKIPRPHLVTPRPVSDASDDGNVDYANLNGRHVAYENPTYSTSGYQVSDRDAPTRSSPPPSYSSTDEYNTRL